MKGHVAFDELSNAAQLAHSFKNRAVTKGEMIVTGAGLDSMAKVNNAVTAKEGHIKMGEMQGQAAAQSGMMSGITSAVGGIAGMFGGGGGGGGGGYAPGGGGSFSAPAPTAGIDFGKIW